MNQTARSLISHFKIFALFTVLTAFLIAIGGFLAGTRGLVLGLVLAGVMNFASYWFSDKIVLKLYKAEEVGSDQAPELHHSLKKLAQEADIPKPKLYKSSMDLPNAFATGRSPKKGIVCVTEGLLQTLELEEIEGVLAHELSHIKHRDTLINAIVATLAGAIAIIARLAFWGSLFAGGEDNGEVFSSLAFMILTPIIALLIRTSISRTMEFRADRSAVQIHQQKEALSSALKKISQASKDATKSGSGSSLAPGLATGRGRRAGRRPRAGRGGGFSQMHKVSSHLLIHNPFSGEKVAKLFSTHPSLDKRLENIASVEL